MCKVFGIVFMCLQCFACPNKSAMRHSLANIAKRVVIVPSHWQGWFISSNLIKIVPASKEIAGFLYCFLASPYGQTLIKKQIYGAVVDIIEPIHVESIVVPFLRDEKIQREINDKVLDANRKRTEAYNLEQEALKILDEKIIYAR